MQAVQKIIHTIILISLFVGACGQALAKSSNVNGSQECLKQNTLIEITKSAFYDLQTIDPTITLNDVKAVILSTGDCAILEEVNAAIDIYREQLIANSGSGSSATSNTAPALSGEPESTVEVGSLFSFIPTASDADLDALSFSISNQPQWASFDTATGALSGIPSETDIGQYTNIVLSVSDGISTSTLPVFSIEVVPIVSQISHYTQIQSYTVYAGLTSDNLNEKRSLTTGNSVTSTANLSQADTYYLLIRTQDANGNDVLAGNTDILGYRIYAGTSSDSLVPVSDLVSEPNSIFEISNLAPGTYYMSVTVFDINGNIGPLSDILEIIVM